MNNNSNNNFGNKPQFGNSPFSKEEKNELSTRSSVGSFRPAYGSFGSSYGRPSSFGSYGGFGRPSYGGFGRPSSFGSYGGFQRPSYGGFGRPSSFGSYGGFQRPSYGGFGSGYGRPMSSFGSPYASRFTPSYGSRYGGTIPPLFQKPIGEEVPKDVYNKYSLENAQPQGVDVHNNFEQVNNQTTSNYQTQPQYEQPTTQVQNTEPQYNQVVEPQQYDQVAEPQQYDQVVEQQQEQAQSFSQGQQLDAEFLKAWEPSLKSLSELSSYGVDQRGSYIIDDIGNVIGDGFEGKQEDPNNPDAEVYDYSSEINAINSAYSYGKEGEIYGSNVLTSNLPSEETASYLVQMGIKAIYYWTNGERAFKKAEKNKKHKRLLEILNPSGCKLIPVLGQK